MRAGPAALVGIVTFVMISPLVGVDHGESFDNAFCSNKEFISAVVEARDVIPMTELYMASPISKPVPIVYRPPYKDVSFSSKFENPHRINNIFFLAPLDQFSPRLNRSLDFWMVFQGIKFMHSVIFEGHSHSNCDITSWQLANVSDGDMPHAFLAFSNEHVDAARFNTQISSQLAPAGIPCMVESLVRGNGRLSGLLNSVARIAQRPIDQTDAKSGDERFNEGSAKHPLSPFRHALLGGEVAASAIFIVGGWFLGILGFKRSGDALDRVLSGNRKAWLPTVAWFCLALVWAWGSGGIVTYWLSVCERC